MNSYAVLFRSSKCKVLTIYVYKLTYLNICEQYTILKEYR